MLDAIEQDPGDDVAGAAAGKRNDDLDRPRRIALRAGGAAARIVTRAAIASSAKRLAVASSWLPFALNLYPASGVVERLALRSLELRRPLGVKRLDALAEIVRLPQPAVAVAFELDRERQRRVFGVVQQLLRRALRERRERAQFVDQRVGRRFELVVRHALGRDAPVIGLLGRNAARAHHDVLGAGDADDLLQPRRAAGARDLAEPLLRQRVEAGLGDDAEVAGERKLEPDAEAIAAVGGDHRLGAARRRGDVPGQLGDESRASLPGNP